MSTLRVNTIQDAVGGTSVSVPTPVRAWVNFNGTGTVAIRAALNVSSITDDGVGLYRVNFTTAMTDANYSYQYTCNMRVSAGETIINRNFATANTASACSIRTMNASGTAADVDEIAVAIFR